MTVAGVQINLRDESSYIPSGSSVFAGIAGAFLKGPLEPTLCTSQSQFLSWFAPDRRPKIGYPQAYQSALDYLEDADALWVVRATNSTPELPLLYGAIAINGSGADSEYRQLADGVGKPEEYSFGENEVILVSGANPGSWNNDVNITFEKNITEGLENAYDLNVYKASTVQGEWDLLEQFLVSRDPQATDGYGNNIYIENVVNGNSNYIMAFNNPLVSDEPKTFDTKTNLLGGSDGDAVTTANYIEAINKLSSYDELPLQLIMDGGITDPAYAKELISMAGVKRNGECFCVLSTPETAEVNTTGGAVTSLTDHRKQVTGTYSYLASMYTPHVRIYDRYNDRYMWNSPDGMMANRINAAIRDYGYNYPAAGYIRGILSNALEVKTKFGGGELTALDNAQINVIKNDTSRGIVAMGNSTLYPTASDLQDQNNMLTINLQIKPGLREFLKDYLFDLNDEITRGIIVDKVNIFMRDVKTQKGVKEFYTVCNATNNTPNDVASGILNIDLYVKMIKSIKFIKTNIVATAQGLDFSKFQ